VPEISRFFGIIIAMFYNDHAPPHFHARYGEQRAIIGIDSLTVLGGRLSPRLLRIGDGVGIASSGGAAGRLATGRATGAAQVHRAIGVMP
jgi:hypothetical protein